MNPAGPLIAHRGASAAYPENTLVAIEQAADQGCRWMEIDVQVTADGVAVLMHDHTVDRTTDRVGPVALMQSADVLGARVRDPVTNAPTDQHPPTLADVLDLCGARDLGLVLEIKATWGVDAEDAAAIAAVLPAKPPFDLLVTSFSVPALQAIRSARPDIALGLACLRPPLEPVQMMARLGLTAFHCNKACTRLEELPRLLEAGAHVAVATINDAELARSFLDAGCHGVMTDHPGLLTVE